MKYLDTILENENIQNLINDREELINLTADILLNYNISLEMIANWNLDKFISENELADTYSNIRDFILESNLQYYDEISEILNSQLNDNEKKEILNSYLTEIADSNLSIMEVKGVRWVSNKGIRSASQVAPMAHKMAQSLLIPGKAVPSMAQKMSQAATPIAQGVGKAVAPMAQKMSQAAAPVAQGVSNAASKMGHWDRHWGKYTAGAGLLGAGTLGALALGGATAAPVAGAAPIAAGAGAGALGAAAGTGALGAAAPVSKAAAIPLAKAITAPAVAGSHVLPSGAAGPALPTPTNLAKIWKTNAAGNVAGTKLNPNQYYSHLVGKYGAASAMQKAKNVGGVFSSAAAPSTAVVPVARPTMASGGIFV